MAITVTAETGHLYSGYKWAADLAKITVARSDDTLAQTRASVSFKILATDEFWSTQPPFTLVLDMEKETEWRWRVEGELPNLLAIGNPEVRANGHQ